MLNILIIYYRKDDLDQHTSFYFGNMSFAKEEVRMIIKISVLLGKSASAIHAELAQVLSEESAPGLSTVKRWAVKFREGEAEVSDAPRSGRPRTATTDVKVSLIQAEDRRLTVQEISLEVGISEGSVRDIGGTMYG